MRLPTRTHVRRRTGTQPTDELDPTNELMSVTEVAAELGLPRQMVLRRLALGSLSGAKVGSMWAIPRSAVSWTGTAH